jgi:pilus assembly protein CpaE
MAAVRQAPGRPVCVVDFDLQKGDFRSYLDTPYRRSVVDLVDVAHELSVRHLQETLYTHKDGFRVLLAPDEGERAEEVGPMVARNVLSAVKARHALTVVDLGANVSEASAVGAELANQLVVVTTPDVVALRGVRRLHELWKRVQVREDEDLVVVLNRTSRKLEIQPDLARKVVTGRLAQTTIPADFGAFEAAVNTGSPARMEDQKLRGVYESLAEELEALPAGEEEAVGGESRGLRARLAGERGQSTVEFMGLVPFLIVLLLGLWQLGLVGYTYLAAAHAAREGARELATDPRDEPKNKPYREVALDEIPKAWRKDAEIERRETVTVRVRLRVPVVLPGLKSPFRIGSQADTSVESAPLPPRQAVTPTPTPRERIQ